MTNNQHTNIEQAFKSFVSAMQTQVPAGSDAISPDGVIDGSGIAESLRSIGDNGRVLKSDERNAIPKWLGSWIAREFGEGTPNDLLRCIQAMTVMVSLVLRAVQTIHPDTCPEEVCMIALSHDAIDHLISDLRATPYRIGEDSQLVTLPLSHSLIARPFDIDARVLHGFMRRHLTPAHYAANEPQADEERVSVSDDDFEVITEPELTKSTESDDSLPAPQPRSRKVSLSDLGRLSADRLNNFGEFEEYFYATDYVLWERGVDMEDLPPFGVNIDPDDLPER